MKNQSKSLYKIIKNDYYFLFFIFFIKIYPFKKKFLLLFKYIFIVSLKKLEKK